MPEHDLEPPHFSKRALEKILNNWTALKAMLNDGTSAQRYKQKDNFSLCELNIMIKSG